MKQLIRIAVLILLCALLVQWGYTQTIKGKVKDTTGAAVPYATVSLKNSTGNAIAAYTLTDNKGAYTLQSPPNTVISSLTVEVRSMGYQTSVKHITSFDVPVDFTLKASVNQLQGVIIKSSSPVLHVNGDTLSYKVSDFANPQDRTIGEVISKLPGITVATDGTISYNGKRISALYIGGDNLLDDKYNIATNSIPQGVVNQVQVIQNDQHIKVLQNKVMNDNAALNLEIKKGAKLHLVGQETIGAGLPGNYDIDLNGMIFKDSYKAINDLTGNNTGNNVQRRVISHKLVDYDQETDNVLPLTVLSPGIVSTPQLAEDRYLFDNAGAINLNNLFNLKKNVQLRVNAYYIHDTQKQGYSQQTTVLLPGDTVRYKELQQNRMVPDIFHTQFTLNINRENYYLNDVLLMNYQNNSNYSGLQTDSSAVDQLFKDKMVNFSNEFNLIKTFKTNKIIQAYSYISHSSEPEKLAITPGYNAAIFNTNMPYAQLVQHVDIPSWYTNNYVSFKILSAMVTQSYRAGFSVQSETLRSALGVVQNDNSVSAPPDSLRNHTRWTKQKLYAEAAYDLPGTIFQANLTIPVALQQINYSDSLLALGKHIRRLYVNPHLTVKYQVSAENYVNFLYDYSNRAGNIENVYPGYILTNYRTLNANSGDLAEQQIQQAGGGFSYRKALKLFFWGINASYSHTSANNLASSVITNNIQKGIVLPYANSTSSWVITGFISKYLFAWHTTLSGNVQWQSSRSVQIQNNALLPFNTTTATFSINADAKVSNTVNFNYKTTLTQTGSYSTVDASAYRVGQLVQKATVNYAPVDNWQFTLLGEHYFTYQQGNPNLAYFFADASVKFRAIKRKTDFQLSAANFLNVKSYNALYLSANTLTASSYTLPGRIIMFKIIFNF